MLNTIDMADFKFKYKFDKKYNPKYINGAHGGINPQGEIIINFYLERLAVPNSETIEVIGDLVNRENIKQSEPSDYNSSLIRMVQNGVIMNYATAKEIHRWLGQHIEQLEQLNTNKINHG